MKVPASTTADNFDVGQISTLKQPEKQSSVSLITPICDSFVGNDLLHIAGFGPICKTERPCTIDLLGFLLAFGWSRHRDAEKLLKCQTWVPERTRNTREGRSEKCVQWVWI